MELKTTDSSHSSSTLPHLLENGLNNLIISEKGDCNEPAIENSKSFEESLGRSKALRHSHNGTGIRVHGQISKYDNEPGQIIPSNTIESIEKSLDFLKIRQVEDFASFENGQSSSGHTTNDIRVNQSANTIHPTAPTNTAVTSSYPNSINQRSEAQSDQNPKQEITQSKTFRLYNVKILVPPLNFALVAEDVYRSGHPLEINYPFFENLNLKQLSTLATLLVPKIRTRTPTLFAFSNDTKSGPKTVESVLFIFISLLPKSRFAKTTKKSLDRLWKLCWIRETCPYC